MGAIRPNTAAEAAPENPLAGIKQALASHFVKKILNPKQLNEEQKKEITELRNKFLPCLAKIYDNATQQDGVIRCHTMIKENSDNAESLRVILGALCDKSLQTANADKKPQGLMFHVQMFGFLAQQFKTELKDPLDRPPSLPKTIQRIQESIYTFFKSNSRLVWRGCAISLQEIFENCFIDRAAAVLGYQSAANFIFDPLLTLLTGGSNTI